MKIDDTVNKYLNEGIFKKAKEKLLPAKKPKKSDIDNIKKDVMSAKTQQEFDKAEKKFFGLGKDMYGDDIFVSRRKRHKDFDELSLWMRDVKLWKNNVNPKNMRRGFGAEPVTYFGEFEKNKVSKFE